MKYFYAVLHIVIICIIEKEIIDAIKNVLRAACHFATIDVHAGQVALRLVVRARNVLVP